MQSAIVTGSALNASVCGARKRPWMISTALFRRDTCGRVPGEGSAAGSRGLRWRFTLGKRLVSNSTNTTRKPTSAWEIGFSVCPRTPGKPREHPRSLRREFCNDLWHWAAIFWLNSVLTVWTFVSKLLNYVLMRMASLSLRDLFSKFLWYSHCKPC